MRKQVIVRRADMVERFHASMRPPEGLHIPRVHPSTTWASHSKLTHRSGRQNPTRDQKIRTEALHETVQVRSRYFFTRVAQPLQRDG